MRFFKHNNNNDNPTNNALVLLGEFPTNDEQTQAQLSDMIYQRMMMQLQSTGGTTMFKASAIHKALDASRVVNYVQLHDISEIHGIEKNVEGGQIFQSDELVYWNTIIENRHRLFYLVHSHYK